MENMIVKETDKYTLSTNKRLHTIFFFLKTSLGIFPDISLDLKDIEIPIKEEKKVFLDKYYSRFKTRIEDAEKNETIKSLKLTFLNYVVENWNNFLIDDYQNTWFLYENITLQTESGLYYDLGDILVRFQCTHEGEISPKRIAITKFYKGMSTYAHPHVGSRFCLGPYFSDKGLEQFMNFRGFLEWESSSGVPYKSAIDLYESPENSDQLKSTVRREVKKVMDRFLGDPTVTKIPFTKLRDYLHKRINELSYKDKYITLSDTTYYPDRTIIPGVYFLKTLTYDSVGKKEEIVISDNLIKSCLAGSLTYKII
jgi:hypothetical protein